MSVLNDISVKDRHNIVAALLCLADSIDAAGYEDVQQEYPSLWHDTTTAELRVLSRKIKEQA